MDINQPRILFSDYFRVDKSKLDEYGAFDISLVADLPLFSDYGQEKVTRSSHLEKLCLIKDGVGKDNISDFTTNLIKDYLLQYTQTFAQKYLDPALCREFRVPRARFNYDTKSWEEGRYYLPSYLNDFVILTPKDMLTKDETWINKDDLVDEFQSIPYSISNEELRAKVNNYFRSVLPEKPKKKDEKEAAIKTILEFPELIDYYIKRKEDNGDRATSISEQKVT